jgi:hypothetical protein
VIFSSIISKKSGTKYQEANHDESNDDAVFRPVFPEFAGNRMSQAFRKRIEECFGWAKTIGGLRKSRFIGCEKLNFQFVMTFAAYNLIRICNLGVASC